MVSANFSGRPFRLEEATWLLRQEGNWSLYRCELWIYKNSYSPSWSNAPGQTFRHWINGAYVNQSASVTYDFTSSDSLMLSSVDVWIEHNADGTKTFDIWADASLDLLGSATLSTTRTAPKIARASTASFAGGASFDAGAAQTIHTNWASTSFTHDITYKVGSATGTIGTGVGASVAWTPPLSLLTQFPNATERDGELTTVTKDGATVVGTTKTPFTLRAPASAVPTISGVTVADDNPVAASQIGAFVQGQSLLKATVIAAGVQGSTIATRAWSIDGGTAASGVALPLPLSGSRSVAAVATDSRGRASAAWSGSVTVLPYAEPTISTYTVERCTSSGVVDPGGAYLKVTLVAAVTGLTVGGVQKQNLQIKISTKNRAGGGWVTRNTITQATLTYNSSFVVTGGGIFSPNGSYDVRVEVIDKLNTSDKTLIVPTAAAILHSLGGKVALGKRVEDAGPAVQLGGPARTYGAHEVDGALTAPSVATPSLGLAEATEAATDAGTAGNVVITPRRLKRVADTKAPVRHYARVVGATTQPVATTAAAITWSAVGTSQGAALWAAGQPTRLTVPTAGTYRVAGVINESTGGKGLGIALFQNGVRSDPHQSTRPHVADWGLHADFGFDIPLAAGDYIDVRVWATAAGTINRANSWVSIERII